MIPTFRRSEMLNALLRSLREGSRVPDEVIVVDNDPERSANPDPIPGLVVRVVHVGLGLNLAGARNAGWRHADSDLCAFIDDDNVVERNAISELARAFDAADIGFAGPVIYAGDTGLVWCGGIRRSAWTGVTRCLLRGKSVLPSTTTWHTDDMPDALAVPRPVLEAVNGFDDQRFPFYYDEADLATRIRARGWQTIVVRDARVRHYGWVGISPGAAAAQAVAMHSASRARQMGLSRVRFHMRHSRGLRRLSSAGVFIPGWMMWTMAACLLADGSWRDRLATVRAIGAGTFTGYREVLRRPRKAGVAASTPYSSSPEPPAAS
ncbi:MAG: glycosyltransferase family 2 protein [Acidimicrobiales bacterium]